MLRESFVPRLDDVGILEEGMSAEGTGESVALRGVRGKFAPLENLLPPHTVTAALECMVARQYGRDTFLAVVQTML